VDILDEAPPDPILRIAWIKQAESVLDAELSKCLFDARLRNRFEEARLEAGLARKPAVARTRAENERRGRQIRWHDH